MKVAFFPDAQASAEQPSGQIADPVIPVERGSINWDKLYADTQRISSDYQLDLRPQAIVKQIVQTLPLARMGTPEDLAGMCLFLLSDEASWITGQIFNVDGGQIIRS